MLLFCLSQNDAGIKTGGGNGKANDGTERSRYLGAIIKGQVIPKDRPTEITIIETEKSTLLPKEHKIKSADKECPGRWYGGIGIESETNNDTGLDTITKVFEGYPADLAGLVVGEAIIRIEEEEIIGEPGTILHIITNKRAYAITRGKICY